jgi:integrase
MRIGEVLKLTPNDIEDRKLTLRAPKSGKEREIVFIPQKIADRLKEYIARKGIGAERILPISYTAGREVVNKAGKVVGIHLKPHDLRRHAATYASRSRVPIEIVSKVILRHANLSTPFSSKTQQYYFQTAVFWSLKNATKIADSEPSLKREFRLVPLVIDYTYKSSFLDSSQR